eukprot:Nitzschia sp. Nitz4//scaffold3_size479765//417414//422217//NITZ4_000178-RA/size479765-processed-gene-1.550-mRNA-1//-1//CDS//3329550992//3908//frame0
MGPKKKTKSRSAWSKPKWVELVVPVLALIGLYWFSASFFLAKRSLPHVSTCDEAPGLLRQTLGLNDKEVTAALSSNSPSKGCWLNRRIDSLVILVVDALRFDFARYELPLSVGARIDPKSPHHPKNKHNRTTSSQLLQFVADPPTVTMQRLKGLTTGSLPTFADISGNMGGANIDEDSWVQQLKDTPYGMRGLFHPSRLGFVGDDTWVDLFPTQFDESFPFPSFNTRDLDTVDNGCLAELPRLLKHLKTSGASPEELEVIVSHFLGVDHVGHTYGPHDKHMHEKLRQMDVALSTTLEILDESDHCHLALIFGDHGMTEDGNHGGGSENEINAALFVHFSPACGDMPLDLAPQMGSKYIQDAFQSIHQIDLVPTISILLGLPIPYANLGGIAPTLLGFEGVRETTAALALNAAQVWRYFSVYSSTANKLPNLPELHDMLEEATLKYKEALSRPDADDAQAYYAASGLYKVFLVEAAELGHRVWTRFDTVGMIAGGTILVVALLLFASSLYYDSGKVWNYLPSNQFVELGLAAVFVVFHGGVLSFSNSYIQAEQVIVVYMMTILGVAVTVRLVQSTAGGHAVYVPYLPLGIPLLARVAESVVSGHGLDPSIRLHWAHSPTLFLPSLAGLLGFRVLFYGKVSKRVTLSLFHTIVDCISLGFITLGWLEKRSLDQSRNGYLWMRISIAMLLVSTPVTIYQALQPLWRPRTTDKTTNEWNMDLFARVLALVVKLLMLVMVVTGPAAASTVLFVSLQGCMLYILCGTTGFYEKKAFIDRKKASTYHVLYRSQRDVADDDEEGGSSGVVLWPSPNNNSQTDEQVLLGKKAKDGLDTDSTLDGWKQQLSKAGLVDDFDYESRMKPITGTGSFVSNKTNNSKQINVLAEARNMNIAEEQINEVDRKLDSIALTTECMDEDIANALFGDFDENDYEELNDEYFIDAAQEPADDEEEGESGFDFASHIQSLMDKARKERDGTGAMDIIHEQGQQDRDFFSKSTPLGAHDEDDEFDHFEDDGDVWNFTSTPGVVPKLNEDEEKALCEKFESTLLEYDSDEIGEGVDDDDVLGPLPLEGDKEIEAAIDDFLVEKQDEVFMTGTREEMKNRGGSGFSALVGTRMVPAKEIDEAMMNVQGEMKPISDVLGEADEILGNGWKAPPAEEVLIDGKSYFSEKMRNPWDCESILSTYSNLDNNPVTIGAGGRRRKKKNKKGSDDNSVQGSPSFQPILLSDKTGLPLGVLPTQDDDDLDDGIDTFVSVNRGEARDKQESKDNKRARKQGIKKERQVARMQKKMMKEAFSDEFSKRQQELMVDDVGGKTVFRF